MRFWPRSKDSHPTARDMIGDYELPNFSGAAISVLGLLRDPNSDLGAIGKHLMADPGLQVQILRTVNAAGFGLRHTVTNLTHAVSHLGRARLEMIVLGAAVREALPSGDGIDLVRFWTTSAHRAAQARQLAQRLHPDTEFEAFTAALLQDMAVPVMASALGADYCDLYNRWGDGAEAPLQELEFAAFDTDHAVIGATMAETWGLPKMLITAIADHHRPDGGSPAAVVAVGYLRDSREPDAGEAVAEHCAQLGIDAESWTELYHQAEEEAVALAQSISA